MVRWLAIPLVLSLPAVSAAQLSDPTTSAPSNANKFIAQYEKSLAEVLAAENISERLPPSADGSRVLSCTYWSADGTKPETHYSWYSSRPTWLASVPDSSKIRTLVTNVANACRRSLGNDPEVPEDAPLLNAWDGRDSVQFVALDASESLVGKWTLVAGLNSPTWSERIATEGDLLQRNSGVLSATPIELKNDGSYCLHDYLESRQRCFMLGKLAKGGFVTVELGGSGPAPFVVLERVSFSAATARTLPTRAEIEVARVDTVRREQETAKRIVAQRAEADARAAAATASATAARDAAGFVTRQLQQPQVFIDIYEGTFTSVPFEPSDVALVALFAQVVESSATSSCPAPTASRVELQQRVCDERTVEAVSGRVVDPCSDSHFVGRGVYADAELHRVAEALGFVAMGGTLSMLGDVPKGLPFTELIAQSVGKVSERQRVMTRTRSDVRALYSSNQCDSPGMRQFLSNMRVLARRIPLAQ